MAQNILSPAKTRVRKSSTDMESIVPSPGTNAAPRILIVRIGAMGDVLHAMPAVAALRAALPQAFIGWAIEPGWSELLETADELDRAGYDAPRGPAMPLVDRWHAVPARAWAAHPFTGGTWAGIAGLRRELRAEHYDIAVDLQGSIKSAVVAFLASAKNLVGPADPREAQASWFYHRSVHTNAPHVVEQACEILSAATGQSLSPTRVPLPVDDEAETWADDLLAPLLRTRDAAGSPGTPSAPYARLALIAPTAGWGAKQWPPERFGALASALAKSGIRTVVNEPTANDPIAAQVVAASNGTAVAIPCSIGDLIALLRHASLVIAGDTGPLHLAAALERPVIGLFGPTDPGRNGPWGPYTRVLRHASSTKDHTRRDETEEGLMQITVTEVAEAALALLHTADAEGRVTA